MKTYKRVLILLFAVLPFTGCGFRTHPITTRTSTAELKEATPEQLVAIINNNADRLKSLKAAVNIDSSVLEQKKNQVKDNRKVGGWVMVRKPEMLRMIGLWSFLRIQVFDMVSNGQTFELSLPLNSKFIVGSDRQPAKPSEQPLENIRPQHILDALLLKRIDPEKEIAVLENSTEIVKDPKSHKDVEQADYVIYVIARDDGGSYLSRKLVFSRTDLLPHEQYIYNRQGQLETYAHYENFADYSGTMFPAIVSIQRPIEGYYITLSITKLDINSAFTDADFALARPQGSQLIDLDSKPSAAAFREGTTKKPQ